MITGVAPTGGQLFGSWSVPPAQDDGWQVIMPDMPESALDELTQEELLRVQAVREKLAAWMPRYKITYKFSDTFGMLDSNGNWRLPLTPAHVNCPCFTTVDVS